jgi:hypothetical protein
MAEATIDVPMEDVPPVSNGPNEQQIKMKNYRLFSTIYFFFVSQTHHVLLFNIDNYTGKTCC